MDAFQENERHYSLFGDLNATADTQFVRVEPLRDGLPARAPSTLDATVQLTHLATQQSFPQQDSLFRYLDGATVHNFYTTMDIEPTASYRVVVRGPGEAESRAQTTVPDTFPDPTVLLPVSEPIDAYDNPPALLRIPDMHRRAAVTDT